MGTIEHAGPISSVAVGVDHWASAGYDNRVILWKSGARGAEAVAQGMHDHLVNHCEFSRDGCWLVTASSDYSARVWRVPDLQLQAVLTGHGDDVDMASFSPDGQWIATCALDRAVRVFNRQGRCLHTLWGHTGNIIALVWREDGTELVSSGVDGTVREWDLATGRESACHDLGVRTDTLVVDAGGRILAGDDLGRIAWLGGAAPVFTQAHRAGIKKLVLCRERGVLVSLSYDRTLAIWHCDESGGLHERQRSTLPAVVWSRAAAVLDQQRLLLGTFGSRPAIYDWVADCWDLDGVVPDASINALALHQGHRYAVGDAGRVLRDGEPWVELGSLCNFLLPAGAHIYAGGQLGMLFDADTGAVLHRHHSPLNCAAQFERNGAPHLAVGSYTGEILVFVLVAQRAPRLVATLAAYPNAVKGLAAAEGQLFSVCANGDASWHELESLAVVRRRSRAHDKIANACCAAGLGRMASVGRDRSLRLWTEGKVEIHPSPHQHSIKSLCASADGNTLMTGSYGGTVAAFDVPSRHWTRYERPTTAGISSIVYDVRRACFLAAAYDGAIHVLP